MVEIKKVVARELYDIRLKVLREGKQDVSLAVFEGDDDATSAHFKLLESGQLAGCVSVIKEGKGNENEYRLRGLAVYEEYRGKGYGISLIKMAEYYAFVTVGAEILWLNSRVHAEGLYLKQGYKKQGDVFMIENVGEHVLMIKNKSEYKTCCHKL